MNAAQLTDVLSEQVTLLRAGKVEPKITNAIVNAAGKILATQRLLLEYAKATKQVPHAPFLIVNAKNGKKIGRKVP